MTDKEAKQEITSYIEESLKDGLSIMWRVTRVDYSTIQLRLTEGAAAPRYFEVRVRATI